MTGTYVTPIDRCEPSVRFFPFRKVIPNEALSLKVLLWVVFCVFQCVVIECVTIIENNTHLFLEKPEILYAVGPATPFLEGGGDL